MHPHGRFRLCAAGLAALAAALPLGASAAAPPATDLRIVVWPRGLDRASVTFTLKCDPARGTLPDPPASCRALAALAMGSFLSVPRGRACIQIYGGPEEARVLGTVRGVRVDARFKRTDGCEIARWNKVAFLFSGLR